VPVTRSVHMDENRRASRQRVLKAGTIEFDQAAYSCMVRNLSDTGAALDLPNAKDVPSDFRLVTDYGRVMLSCRVVWRKKNRLGVVFA
jgi:hypothetical protein